MIGILIVVAIFTVVAFLVMLFPEPGNDPSDAELGYKDYDPADTLEDEEMLP